MNKDWNWLKELEDLSEAKDGLCPSWTTKKAVTCIQILREALEFYEKHSTTSFKDSEIVKTISGECLVHGLRARVALEKAARGDFE